MNVEDVAWQAFQAGVSGAAALNVPDVDAVRDCFNEWWSKRVEQGCALPACSKCGHDPSAQVVASWEFLICREPPSLNDRLFNAGNRRWAYRKERDAWCWEFRAAKLREKVYPARARRRVSLTRMYGGRQKIWDADNFSGGQKSTIDAMVSERILVDDSPRWAEIYYSQLKHEKMRGLWVRVEELA